MDKRLQELQKLKSYTEGIDKQLTMILQTLQWDRKHLLQKPVLVTCRYDSNHKVPPDKAEEHEKECFLRQNGYSKDDQLLPDPIDLESDTLVKLKKEDIEQIIANASRTDPLFKQGVGCRDAEPMSLERLQTSYSADERRVIHDAVVNAVPSCHDLTDLALLSGGDEKSSGVILSRQEILAELRNMRRRRTKYRVAAKSRNYSDVLRDVIKTQMEHYNDVKGETDPKETVDRDNSQRDKHDDFKHSRPMSKDTEKYRYRYDRKIVPRPIQIKTEKEDSTERNYRVSQTDFGGERSDRYEKGSRERRDRDNDRRHHYDRSRERKKYEDVDRTQKYGEPSRKRRYDDEPRDKRHYHGDSKDNRNTDERDKEHRSGKRSRNDHRQKDYNPEHQVKIEPGIEEESNNHQGGTSRDRRHDEKRDKTHKHKDKNEKRRDRERSQEKRKDTRHEERSSERIHIKQEREDTDNYKKEKADRTRKSKSKRHDKSHRDEHNDSHGLENGGASGEIYDPNKKIKVEK